MKIVCPEDSNHNRFSVSAHVVEFWIVDEMGEFETVSPDGVGDVLHRPDSQDAFTCASCGADAIVKD